MSYFNKDTRYLVHAYAPGSRWEYREDWEFCATLVRAVEIANRLAQEPADPDIEKEEKRHIAIYQLVEIVKDTPLPGEQRNEVKGVSEQ